MKSEERSVLGDEVSDTAPRGGEDHGRESVTPVALTRVGERVENAKDTSHELARDEDYLGRETKNLAREDDTDDSTDDTRR